jgi:MFS family permease
VWMQRLAQDWLVLQLTGSPAAVGIAVALQFLPMLVVGPLSGLLVDLFPKRRILLVCQSVAALLAARPACLERDGRHHVWVVYASCIALGVTSAIMAQPASRSSSTKWWATPDSGRPSASTTQSGSWGPWQGRHWPGWSSPRPDPPRPSPPTLCCACWSWCMIAAIRPAELHPPAAPAARGRGQILAGFRYVVTGPPAADYALAGLLGMPSE